MILRSVESVLSLVLIMGLGWWLAGQSWFGQKGGSLFSRFAVQICGPAYMCYNIQTTCETPEDLLRIVAGLPAPLVAILLGGLLGVALIWILKVKKGRKGVFFNAVTFCNTVLVGFPIILALFGDEAAPDAMVYYMANSLLFWTVGVYTLRADSGETPPFFSRENLKKLVSPPLVGLVTGSVLVLMDIHLPYFLLDSMLRVGQCMTPMAMLFIGCILRATDLRSIWRSREIWAVIGVRLLLSPLMMYLLLLVFPLPLQMRRVFFVMSTMPAMTLLGIMAKESGSDAYFASAAVASTTLVCMAALPLFAIAMESIPLLH